MNNRNIKCEQYYDTKEKVNLYILSIMKEDILFVNDADELITWSQELFKKYILEGRLEPRMLEKVNTKVLKQFKDVCCYGKLKLHIIDPQSVKVLAEMKYFKELIEYINAGKYLIVVHNYFKSGYWRVMSKELSPVGVWDKKKKKRTKAQAKAQDQDLVYKQEWRQDIYGWKERVQAQDQAQGQAQDQEQDQEEEQDQEQTVDTGRDWVWEQGQEIKFNR